MGESGTVSDERRTLTESAITGSLESDVDDESEVFGSEERRDVFLDQVETSLEPFCGFSESGEDIGLSARKATSQHHTGRATDSNPN